MSWSNKYKRSIDCDNPQGFSQKAHCAARKKRSRGEKTQSRSPFNEMNQLKSHKTVEQIAKKHRLDVAFIQKQLDMGEPIEHEHTKDHELATDIALQHLDEIPDYYTRLKKMEADAKKHHKKFKDVKEHCGCEDNAVEELESALKKLDDTSYDSIDSLMRRIMKKHDMTAKQLHNAFVDKNHKTPDDWIKEINEGTLHHWFKGSKSKDGKPGWVQADGSPCANEPGETKTPKCFSSARLKALKSKGEKGEALIRSAIRRKRGEDKGQQQKSGAAKPTNVPTFAKGKKDPNYIKAEPGIKESMELNEAQKDKPGKGSGKKDACYQKVKSRYDVWPSAYASGALVKCRKVGAANWGTKSEECWDGYKQEGMKKKGKKIVPNCVPVKEEQAMIIRYCPKCKKDETRDECKYGAKYWDMFSRPVSLGKKYHANSPHPGNFPEGYDHEYSMARSELSKIANAAKRLKKKLGKGEGELEAWVQSKITKAADYIDTAADYVDSGEMKEENQTIEKPVSREEKAKIRKMQKLHKLMQAAKEGREKSDLARESVSIEDVNGNHYVEFIDIIKPEPLNPSKGIGSQLVSEGVGFEINPQAHKTAQKREKIRSLAVGGTGGERDVAKAKLGPSAELIKFADSYSNWRQELGLSEDWQKVNRQDRTDGLSQKAVDAYRRENPGSKLQTAVTEKKPTGKRAKRRANFCRRMRGMKDKLTSAETARDPDSRINKALRRWRCN